MLRKAKRLPVIVMLVLIAVFLGSLSGCGDSADPLGTGIIQFYDASTGVIITSVTIQPGSSVTLVVRVMILRSDGTLAPVIGERVAFTLMTPGNGGGLTVVNERTAGNGQAMAVYTAGNNSSTDNVRATTSNGATASITITKVGGLVGPRISTPLAGPLTPVAAYQTSVITATVTDGNSNPVANEPVTFTLPTNQSDACFINAASGSVPSITVNSDASGRAVALYRAGGYDPYSDVSDTVRAALANGSSNSLVIIRSAGTPPVPLSISVAASPAVLAAGQASIITATLTGDGKAGVLVTFSLPVNNSGASLSASSAVTDGSGNAVVTYMAGGNNSMFTVSDSVQAVVGSISSSAAITRTGEGAPPPTTPLSIAVAASSTSVSAGQVSIITATLTGENNAGVTVTFSLPVNNSGASLSASSAVTDGGGRAVVTYTAGANSPTLNVSDVVKANVSTISSSAAITRTGTGTPIPISIAVAASPTSVNAGQVSVITATLTGASISGVTVNFTLPVNNSGATLSAASAVTDGGGRAVVTYTAGANSPTLNVSDTVQAATGTATGVAVITRTGTGTPIPISIAVAASPTSVNAGQVSVITATLTGASISGVTVNFTLPVNNSGATLSAASAVTDGGGRAVVTYTAGANSPTLNVSDTVQAATGTATGVAVITRTGTGTPIPISIAVAASPTSVNAGQVSVITATLTGASISGVTVNFTLPVNNSGATLSAASAVTDGGGRAVVIYQPGTTNPTITVQDTVQAAVGTATSTVAITRVGSATSGFSITVAADPNPLSVIGGSSVITANVKNNQGTVVTGVTVTFTSSAGSLNGVAGGPVTAITDGSGNAQAVLTGTGGAASATAAVVTATITISGNIYNASVVITNP